MELTSNAKQPLETNMLLHGLDRMIVEVVVAMTTTEVIHVGQILDTRVEEVEIERVVAMTTENVDSSILFR